jgi:hypothetical protein
MLLRVSFLVGLSVKKLGVYYNPVVIVVLVGVALSLRTLLLRCALYSVLA